ncbi:MAG: glycosyltransferase family 4 protein, partial [Terracidiphilus sp.]|nr:glycosyltransferase family 4 protein [Terracidiphilus sp.]
MNIVHFTTGRVNPAAAKVGLVNVIYWLADAQAKAGHHVSVVVCPVKRDYENATQAAFEIREYPYSILGGMFVEKQLLSDIQLGSLKIDIAHLHGVWNMHMAAIGSALYKLGIPYVVSSHGSFAP